MATAIGQVIDIPIIIRSLSRDFYRSATRMDYSIPLDREFLIALDSGIIPAAGPSTAAGYIVDEFHSAWWTDEQLGSFQETFSNSILSINNIDDCLDFHRHQIKLLPLKNHTLLSSSPKKPTYIWKPDATNPITKSDNCKRCRLYRAVAMGTLDDHRDTYNLIQGMESTFKMKKEEALRRASGFNQLYEYLLIKEQNLNDAPAAAMTANDALIPPPIFGSRISRDVPIEAPLIEPLESLPPMASKKSKKGKKVAGRRAVASAVRSEAIAELRKIENVPSLKWTWGAEIDSSDLLALRRSVDMGYRLPHSGYDISLTEGSDTRSRSTVRDLGVNDDTYYGEISEEAARPIPDLNPNKVPSCLYIRIRKKPSRYLMDLHHADRPQYIITDDYPAAVPVYVPAPKNPRFNPSASDIEKSKLIVFEFLRH